MFHGEGLPVLCAAGGGAGAIGALASLLPARGESGERAQCEWM